MAALRLCLLLGLLAKHLAQEGRVAVADGCFTITDRSECCNSVDGRTGFYGGYDCVPSAPSTTFSPGVVCEPSNEADRQLLVLEALNGNPCAEVPAYILERRRTDCQNSTDWLGQRSVEDCARSCSSYLFFVHATDGDLNCKCAICDVGQIDDNGWGLALYRFEEVHTNTATMTSPALAWTNGAGDTCADYATNGWCDAGSFTVSGSPMGAPNFVDEKCADFGDANCARLYNYPAQSCAVCGAMSGLTTATPTSLSITGQQTGDIVAWANLDSRYGYVATTEGNDIESRISNVDVCECASRCDANPSCYSFAHCDGQSGTDLGRRCYLKDLMLEGSEDTRQSDNRDCNTVYSSAAPASGWQSCELDFRSSNLSPRRSSRPLAGLFWATTVLALAHAFKIVFFL